MKKIFTKALLYNLLIALGITLLLLLLVNWGLKVYTRHGQTQQVPDVRGKSFSDASDILDHSHLDLEIMDSTYMPDKPALSIIDQNPKPGTSVKAGRTIYLTINAAGAPIADIPDLVGKSSYKYARIQLEGMGFKVGDPIYRPDPHRDAVLGMLVAGKPLKAGSKIAKGTTITLLLGEGLTDKKINVPYLIGLRYDEALVKLHEEYNLSLGALIVSEGVTDTARAFVWKTEPGYGSGRKIRVGEELDFFLIKEMPDNIVIHPELYNQQDSIPEEEESK